VFVVERHRVSFLLAGTVIMVVFMLAGTVKW